MRKEDEEEDYLDDSELEDVFNALTAQILFYRTCLQKNISLVTYIKKMFPSRSRMKFFVLLCFSF